MKKVVKTEKEWKKILSKQEFSVCRKKGTEQAFSGKYYNCIDEGIYHCTCCGVELFSSNSKFDSGTGWPSFYTAINDDSIITKTDLDWMMKRTEVRCNVCDSHLGHVFDEGSAVPTGKRYCINSVALKLKKKK